MYLGTKENPKIFKQAELKPFSKRYLKVALTHEHTVKASRNMRTFDRDGI